MLMWKEETFIEDEIIFNPPESEQHKKDYYLAKARCRNCDYPKTKVGYEYMSVLIQKGRPKPTPETYFTCHYCGCKYLQVF